MQANIPAGFFTKSFTGEGQSVTIEPLLDGSCHHVQVLTLGFQNTLGLEQTSRGMTRRLGLVCWVIYGCFQK